MEGKQRIYYALGQLAYVVALADGEIQAEEKKKLHSIITDEIKNHDQDFDYTNIIFNLLGDEVMSPQDIFDAAFEEINKASYYLTDDMKSDFPAILEKIARASAPITDSEKEWLKQIKDKLEAV